ncbi:MAG: hypothetical protein AB1568_00130 [Thermodesulfobacteriota bacterium]
MQIGIALLLRGDRPDRTAAAHALELAGRNGCILHAVAIRTDLAGHAGKSGPPGGQAIAAAAAQILLPPNARNGQEDVRVQFHLLDSFADGSLARFIAAHRIRLLVSGIAAPEEAAPLLQQAARLGARLGRERSAYLKTLWAVLVEPGEGEEAGAIVIHAERIVWRNSA